MKIDFTCNVLEVCIYLWRISGSFEDSIRNAISIGGDTDTIASIVGSMAESTYGIPSYLVDKITPKLPNDFIKLLQLAYEKII